jgi:hypothetical protein
MPKTLRICSRHTNLVEAAIAAGLNARYHLAAAEYHANLPTVFGTDLTPRPFQAFVVDTGEVVFIHETDIRLLQKLSLPESWEPKAESWSVVQIHGDEIFISDPLIKFSKMAHEFVAREQYIVSCAI